MASHNRFKMIPDADELAGIAREAHFVPAENDAPAVLSTQQINRFNRDGFLSDLSIFDEDEIAEHRLYFDALLEQTLQAGQDSYSISSAHLRYGRAYDLLTHRRIVDCVADLLGENVIGWGAHYFCKLPHDEKSVAWHQDFSYWPLSASRTVTVWLALDDTDCENGCVRFVPGSHRYGLVGFRESSAAEHNVLDQTIENVERFGDPVDIELQAGEISIHSDLLIHGSDANRSDRRRCGLTLRYCTSDVRAELEWNEKGVIVRGIDQSGHWRNPPRPSDE